jgi:photosystem II stability/assembly factor-like uncharacterized protein
MHMPGRFQTPLFTFLLFGAALVLVGQGCVGSSNDQAQTAGPAGMFISQDKAETWKSISLLPLASGVQSLAGSSVYRIFEDPQDPRTMYWATRESGMYYTYNDGQHWMRSDKALSSGQIFGFAVHPTDKCRQYATNGSQIFYSSDCSRSWTEVYRRADGVRINALAIHGHDPYELLAGKRNGEILRSVDGGLSWAQVSSVAGTIVEIIPDPHEEGRMYLGTTSNGLYRSRDAGSTWESLAPGLTQFSKSNEYRRMYLHPAKKDVVYYVSTFGIHISENSGNTWTAPRLIHAPGSAKIYGFGINPKNDNEMYYTATINNRSTLYKSIDGGRSWITKKLPSGQVPTALRVHPEKPEWIYLGFTIPPSQ